MPRILLVDDDRAQCLRFDKLLKDHDFEVDIAHNGREALERIEPSPPDLIVTDLIMPDMDGLELVEAVRNRYPWVPVLVMTSYGSEEVAVRALRLGATSYLNKASLNGQVIELIDEVLAVGGEHRTRHQLLESLTRAEFHFTLENDTRLIPALVHHVQESVMRLHFCDESGCMRLGIALCEALSNSIIHGNLEISSDLRDNDESAYHALVAERRKTKPYSDRRVLVMARVTHDEVSLVIRDEGPGFDANKLRDPTDSANLDLAGGRGLFLIRAFADEVYHNTFGNQLTIIKRREQTAESETAAATN